MSVRPRIRLTSGLSARCQSGWQLFNQGECMSVRPVNFLPNGDIEIVFDEQGHMGTIPADKVKWTSDINGDENHNYIILNCPDGCGASSTHPVGGGADAPMIQEMFVRKIDLEGCPCGSVRSKTIRTSSDQDAITHVKELVTAMDGANRWAL